jgi:hypothetical protein
MSSFFSMENVICLFLLWELRRRDDWWVTEKFGVVPAPKYIVYKYFGPETSTAIALAANDVDAPQIGILSLDTYLQVKKKNPYATAWHERAPYACLDPCPRGLMVQNAKEPFDNRDVRWALSYQGGRRGCHQGFEAPLYPAPGRINPHPGYRPVVGRTS